MVVFQGMFFKEGMDKGEQLMHTSNKGHFKFFMVINKMLITLN